MSSFNDLMTIKTGNRQRFLMRLWRGWGGEYIKCLSGENLTVWRRSELASNALPPSYHRLPWAALLCCLVKKPNKQGRAWHLCLHNASVTIPSATTVGCPSHTTPMTNTAITRIQLSAGYPFLYFYHWDDYPWDLVYYSKQTPQLYGRQAL